MKATITLSQAEVAEIIREHITRTVDGIINVSSVNPIMEYEKFDERHNFEGISVEINLKDKVK